ncbi:MAG TPA: hypothetical protein VIQ24_11445, partial [Pyrinomonadaceae bacterium]
MNHRIVNTRATQAARTLYPAARLQRRRVGAALALTVLASLCLFVAGGAAQGPVTFTNTAPIVIPDATAAGVGVASPYPSAINVAGLSGALTDLNVTLHGLNGSPYNTALLLVAPNGTRMIIQANIQTSSDHSNVSYTLDDSAPADMVLINRIRSDNSYRPTVLVPSAEAEPEFPEVGGDPPPADCLPKGECLSAAPYGTAKLNSAFGGIDPNGTWKLYAVDLFEGETSTYAGGWSLSITTNFIEPMPTPSAT